MFVRDSMRKSAPILGESSETRRQRIWKECREAWATSDEFGTLKRKYQLAAFEENKRMKDLALAELEPVEDMKLSISILPSESELVVKKEHSAKPYVNNLQVQQGAGVLGIGDDAFGVSVKSVEAADSPDCKIPHPLLVFFRTDGGIADPRAWLMCAWSFSPYNADWWACKVSFDHSTGGIARLMWTNHSYGSFPTISSTNELAYELTRCRDIDNFRWAFVPYKVESLDTLILDLGQQVAWEIPGDDEDLIDSEDEEDGAAQLISSVLKATRAQNHGKKHVEENLDAIADTEVERSWEAAHRIESLDEFDQVLEPSLEEHRSFVGLQLDCNSKKGALVQQVWEQGTFDVDYGHSEDRFQKAISENPATLHEFLVAWL
eukprot:s35_g33.t1